MMKITHIEHSGFSVELTNMVLLFDWYKGSLPAFDPKKEIYVLVSHRHPDHYSEKIWKLSECYPKIHYILHKGICKKPPHEILAVRAHETYSLDRIQIHTLLSTDEGVAYLIQAENKTIFHAGDLNLWYWKGEPETDNKWQTGTYHAEINRLKGTHINAAFLTLDPRQEENATLGMEYFLRNIMVDHVIPMHYWNAREKAMSYLDTGALRPFADKIHFEKELLL
ncbi:MAG: MBL fold metallo-hydrolase [Clostridiales bacterium]|nr:MBL fold metallo-hydrolase [Clostridiales bacterium]